MRSVSMKYEYKKNYEVAYSQTDKNANLKLVNAAEFFEDIETEYYGTFNSDNITLERECGAIWVITKAKFHFYRYPMWRDKVHARTYTTLVKPIRCNIEATFSDDNSNIMFVMKNEFCPIDVETRKIRKISSVNYPGDMETENSVYEEGFERLDMQFSEQDKAYDQKVMFSDIDYSNHTNNTMYIKYLSNCFTTDLLDKYVVTDFEIHYISESRENQVLSIYKKEIEHGKIVFLIKHGEREVARAVLRYEEKL